MTMCAILGCSIEAEADGFCTAHGRQVEGFIEAARCKAEGRPDESVAPCSECNGTGKDSCTDGNGVTWYSWCSDCDGRGVRAAITANDAEGG